MYPGSLPFGISLLFISMLTGGLAFYAFHRSTRTDRYFFGWLMVAVTEWSVFYAVELFAPTLQGKLFAVKAEFIGIAAIGPLWLMVALNYTGHSGRLTLRRMYFFAALAAVTIILAFTNESHNLMWVETGLDPLGSPSLVTHYGIWFWVYTVITYLSMVGGVVLYLIAYRQAAHLYRRQIGIMIAGSIMPLIGNFIYISGIFPVRNFDLAPFSFAVSGLLLMWGLFQFNLFDLMPVAASIVVENLNDAVVVVDNFKRIVGVNSIARRWLGVGNDVIGKSALDVLRPSHLVRKYWDDTNAHFKMELGKGENRTWLEVSISLLKNERGNIMGRAIIARDITKEQNLLAAERRRVRQMELLNDITRTSLEATDTKQMLQTLSDELGKLLEADGAFITLWDEKAQRTVPAAAQGSIRSLYLSTNIEPGEITLTESVLRTGKSLVVEDVFNTPYLSPRLAALFQIRSALALPLINKGEKMGAALITFDQHHDFSEDEIALGEQAARQIAVAISKARLYDAERRRASQLDTLEQASRQIAGSLDEREACWFAIKTIVERFGFAEAVILLAVEDDELEIVAVGGTEDMSPSMGLRMKKENGISGHVAETREVYYAEDIAHDPYYWNRYGRLTGSAVGLPMIYDGELLGVLYVENANPNAFDLNDIQTLQTLNAHLVMTIQKARLLKIARDRLRAMLTIQSVSQTVISSLELEEIFQSVVQLLQTTFGYTYISIYLLHEDTLKLGAQVGYPPELVYHEIPISEGIAGRAARTGQVQFIKDVSLDPVFLQATYDVESEICIPFIKEETVLGILNIESARWQPLTEYDLDLLTALAGPIAIAVDNARLHARANTLALTDSLTGLANRRAFDAILESEVSRALRYGPPLSLMVIDVDSFKVYNDEWGHPAGDERLKAIANMLRANVRLPDLAARYGGEEFVVLLPFTGKTGAVNLAERLRAAAEADASQELVCGKTIPGYTISLGVASFPDNGTTPEALLLAADNAELTAKRLGKNRVCLAEDLTGTNS